jgi:TonB family protein
MQWLQKAAAHGNAEGEARIGYLYQEGMGVAQDGAQAIQWYQKAADHGFANAEFSIGYLYDRGGSGIAKDYGQAMEWYRKASAHNVGEAEYFLGLHYEEGAGVDPDPAQAAQWFQKAAKDGSADAKTRIADLEAERVKPPQISTIRSPAPDATSPDAPLQPIVETHTLPPYPLLSQKLGEEGISILRVHISTDGVADDCVITSSSNSTLLDRRACEFVKSQWRWKPPLVQSKPQAAVTNVQVHWNLKQAQQQ